MAICKHCQEDALTFTENCIKKSECDTCAIIGDKVIIKDAVTIPRNQLTMKYDKQEGVVISKRFGSDLDGWWFKYDVRMNDGIIIKNLNIYQFKRYKLKEVI